MFDLDGTLLPMDNDIFVKGYLSLLANVAAKAGGYDKDIFLKGMWKGVAAMTRNDGRCKNEEVFERYKQMIVDFKDYYIRQGFPVYENPSPGNKKGGKGNSNRRDRREKPAMQEVRYYYGLYR